MEGYEAIEFDFGAADLGVDIGPVAAAGADAVGVVGKAVAGDGEVGERLRGDEECGVCGGGLRGGLNGCGGGALGRGIGAGSAGGLSGGAGGRGYLRGDSLREKQRCEERRGSCQRRISKIFHSRCLARFLELVISFACS